MSNLIPVTQLLTQLYKQHLLHLKQKCFLALEKESSHFEFNHFEWVLPTKKRTSFFLYWLLACAWLVNHFSRLILETHSFNNSTCLQCWMSYFWEPAKSYISHFDVHLPFLRSFCLSWNVNVFLLKPLSHIPKSPHINKNRRMKLVSDLPVLFGADTGLMSVKAVRAPPSIRSCHLLFLHWQKASG